MDTIWDNVRLVYDLITFNFEIDDARAISATAGAVVPPELFYRILYWAAQEDTSQSKAAKMRVLADFHQGMEGPDVSAEVEEEMANYLTGPFYTLTCCSLVCRYWANQSRRYLFTNGTLQIKSLEVARAFRFYSLHGSNNLIKLCDIIGKIVVVQQYDLKTEARSLLDIVYFPATRTKLSAVFIYGPPDTVSPCRLDTPHWSVTNGDSFSPSITPYNSVSLRNAAFPSFTSVTKYLKHFRAAQEMIFWDVTWNDKTRFSLARPFPTSYTRPRIAVTASRCTDSFLIGWQAFTLYSDSLFHAVIDRDQDWMLNFVMTIRDYYEELEPKNIYKFISDVSETHQVPTLGMSLGWGLDYPKTQLTFILDKKACSPSISHRSSPKSMRIVGLLIRTDVTRRNDALPAIKYSTPDLGILRAQLETRCALRAVVIAFESYKDLDIIIHLNPSLRDPWTGVSVYRLVYGNRKIVGIDPMTLEPTGESWTNEMDAVLFDGSR